MKASELEKIISDRVDTMVQKFKSPYFGDGSVSVNKALDVVLKSEAKDERTVEIQKRSDDLFLTSAILNKPVKELNVYKSFRAYLETNNVSELLKAMTTGGAGQGAEWIPTGFSQNIYDMVNMERVLGATIPRFNMPTNPFKMPVQLNRATTYRATEGNAPSASAATITGNVEFSAEKLMSLIQYSEELTEDAVTSTLPTIKKALSQGIAFSEEDALVNGDTSASLDSDWSATSDPRYSWKGLRKIAVENSYTSSLATFTSKTLAAMMGKMGKYAAMPGKCRWVVGSKVYYNQLLNLKDDQNNAVVISMDKLGPNATILKGQLGVMFGAPVILSEAMRENWNTAGVYDGSSMVRGAILCYYNDGFMIGDRRNITVKSEYKVDSDSYNIAATQREDFQPMYTAASNKIVWYGYNVTI